MLLDPTAGVIRKSHQHARDAARPVGERSPIIREGLILAIHDNGNLRHVGEADLPPQLAWPLGQKSLRPARMDLILATSVSSTAPVL
jgi:hypothetical protein